MDGGRPTGATPRTGERRAGAWVGGGDPKRGGDECAGAGNTRIWVRRRPCPPKRIARLGGRAGMKARICELFALGSLPRRKGANPGDAASPPSAVIMVPPRWFAGGLTNVPQGCGRGRDAQEGGAWLFCEGAGRLGNRTSGPKAPAAMRGEWAGSLAPNPGQKPPRRARALLRKGRDRRGGALLRGRPSRPGGLGPCSARGETVGAACAYARDFEAACLLLVAVFGRPRIPFSPLFLTTGDCFWLLYGSVLDSF